MRWPPSSREYSKDRSSRTTTSGLGESKFAEFLTTCRKSNGRSGRVEETMTVARREMTPVEGGRKQNGPTMRSAGPCQSVINGWGRGGREI
jgi:hypothetical protein